MTATLAAAAYPALGSARVADPVPAPAPGAQNVEQNFKKDFELDEITMTIFRRLFSPATILHAP